MSAVAAFLSRRTRSSARRERTQPLDREYWLAHCEGYRVESPGGRVGLVEEVRGGEQGGTRSLAVLAGMRGLRRLIIPISWPWPSRPPLAGEIGDASVSLVDAGSPWCQRARY
jgi:hypothetical protein